MEIDAVCETCKKPISRRDGKGKGERQDYCNCTDEAETTAIDIELVILVLDNWIETFRAWPGKSYRVGKALERYKTFILEEKDDKAIAAAHIKIMQLGVTVLFRDRPPSDIENLAEMIRIVGLKFRGGDVAVNHFTVTLQRFVYSRIVILKSMIATAEGEWEGVPVPDRFEEGGERPLDHFLQQWTADQEHIWARTMESPAFTEQIKDGSTSALYYDLMKRALGCVKLPATIVELSMCNLWDLTEELCGQDLEMDHWLTQDGQDVGNGDWWLLSFGADQPDPATLRRKMGNSFDAVNARDRWFWEQLEAKLEAADEDGRLRGGELEFFREFRDAALFFKHATATEAAVNAWALLAPNVSGQEAAFTAGTGDMEDEDELKTLNVNFGHLDYMFGRLECSDGVQAGSSRYGDYRFCIPFNSLGPQVCISLHDQGRPFSQERTSTYPTSGKAKRLVLDMKGEKNDKAIRREWLLNYPKSTKIDNAVRSLRQTKKDEPFVRCSFLNEVFCGTLGCRAGLALTLLVEFRRMNLPLPKFKTGLQLNNLLKDLVRTEIRVPCLVPLQDAKVFHKRDASKKYNVTEIKQKELIPRRTRFEHNELARGGDKVVRDEIGQDVLWSYVTGNLAKVLWRDEELRQSRVALLRKLRSATDLDAETVQEDLSEALPDNIFLQQQLTAIIMGARPVQEGDQTLVDRAQDDDDDDEKEKHI